MIQLSDPAKGIGRLLMAVVMAERGAGARRVLFIAPYCLLLPKELLPEAICNSLDCSTHSTLCRNSQHQQ